jgi:hypothetical protein
MAQLPDWAGLILWNALNLLVLFSALRFLRLGSSPFKHWLAVLLVLQEAIGSTQNAQSNCLVAGLLIWGYLFMEERRPSMAGLSVTTGVFVKLFGGLGGDVRSAVSAAVESDRLGVGLGCAFRSGSPAVHFLGSVVVSIRKLVGNPAKRPLCRFGLLRYGHFGNLVRLVPA